MSLHRTYIERMAVGNIHLRLFGVSCGAPALFLHSSWTALSVRNKNVALLVMATTIPLLLACRLLFWGFSSHYYEQQRQPARKTRKNPQRESSVDLREKQRFLQEKEKGKKKGFLFSTWSACVRNLPCNRAYHRVWKWAQKVSLFTKIGENDLATK